MPPRRTLFIDATMNTLAGKDTIRRRVHCLICGQAGIVVSIRQNDLWETWPFGWFILPPSARALGGAACSKKCALEYEKKKRSMK